MKHSATLESFPYVVVRIGCRKCARQGQYRLARLVERHGASVSLTDLLDLLARTCELRQKHGDPGIDRCGAFYADLAADTKPDIPTKWSGTAAERETSDSRLKPLSHTAISR